MNMHAICLHIEEGTCNRGCRGPQCRIREEACAAPDLSMSRFSREDLQAADRIARHLVGVDKIPTGILIVRPGTTPIVQLHAWVLQMPAGKYFLFRPHSRAAHVEAGEMEAGKEDQRE